MLSRFLAVRWNAWVLLGCTLLCAITFIVLHATNAVSSPTMLYIVQPGASVVLAGMAYLLSKGQRDRVRRKQEKAIIVGSIIAIWFVGYLSTGIFVTFVHNTLVTSLQTILLNIIGFGVTAAAIEYTRHRTLLIAGRHTSAWFGVFVTIVFALPYITLGNIMDTTTAEGVVKLVVSDILPSLTASMLLTYLSIACGFPAQLVYRLGIVAITIFPPIIPKFDWYLLGMSSILLSAIVYLVVDRTIREREASRAHRKKHVHHAFDIMWVSTMTALILLMSGFFAYKPTAIMSNSMHPTFSRGSIVIVQKITNSMDISIGDIIQYEAEGRMITHRVIAIDTADDGSGNRIFTTKGDNSPSRDRPVSADHVFGIIRSTVPYIGYPTVWLREITT